MKSNNITANAEIAGGAYVGYKAISHGLPRALGIRIEYHTTSLDNARLIKKAGNILDPVFGGKNGWCEKIADDNFIKNSKNYVHITGINKNTNLPKDIPNILKAPFRTIFRKLQCYMYKAVGNSDLKDIKENNPIKWIRHGVVKSIFKNKTKKFCIPGIDSYFDKNFINDTDDLALKSAKKIKVYGNRLSAMFAGVKKFGLKGIKENKGRVAFGLGILSIGLYVGYKMIKNGINKIKNKHTEESNFSKK